MLTNSERSHRAVALWLLVVCASVFAMVVIGGITRLTNSGLSMVDWQPLMGIIPPLSEAEWQATFDAYKAYPEYQKINAGMSLDGFKSIFFWEYFHRLFGRLIGLIYFVPFMIFLVRGQLKQPGLVSKLTVGLVLGGLQGLMGWYMVKSGLVDRPDVSHYRLAAHLLLAMLVLGYLFWLALDLVRPAQRSAPAGAVGAGWLMAGLLFLQITYGAFTAGLNAGYGFNTYPMMGEQWLAAGALMLDPWWANLLENTAMLQFVHRWVGALYLLVVLVMWVRARRSGAGVTAMHVLLGLSLAQFLLGVITLVLVVPLPLASLHQAGACLLVLALVNYLQQMRLAQGDARLALARA